MGIEVFVIAAIVMGGCAYTSYRIGFREGTGAYIEFCKSRRDKAGYTCMHFFGDRIEFVDTLEYNKAVLDSIAESMNDKQS
tara:strand:- start:5258 stop:5500 length:243 start_codon:yes stop_codon:yes gene_type:complete